jgi:hypothetical protein
VTSDVALHGGPIPFAQRGHGSKPFEASVSLAIACANVAEQRLCIAERRVVAEFLASLANKLASQGEEVRCH